MKKENVVMEFMKRNKLKVLKAELMNEITGGIRHDEINKIKNNIAYLQSMPHEARKTAFPEISYVWLEDSQLNKFKDIIDNYEKRELFVNDLENKIRASEYIQEEKDALIDVLWYFLHIDTYKDASLSYGLPSMGEYQNTSKIAIEIHHQKLGKYSQAIEFLAQRKTKLKKMMEKGDLKEKRNNITNFFTFAREQLQNVFDCLDMLSELNDREIKLDIPNIYSGMPKKETLEDITKDLRAMIEPFTEKTPIL